MIDKVRTCIQKNGMISPGDHLLAGISGGADSVCLFYVLKSLMEELAFTFTAVHVEHKIRGEEALRDAAFVEELCRKEGIACRVVHVDVPALASREGVGLEEAGRLARQRIFRETAQKEGASRIALAHHLNDRAETLLFNLARGTGLAGMGSIRPVRGPYIRPLIDVTREEILAYLKARGAAWQEDSTNAALDMSRNRLRHEIIPSLRDHVNSRVNENLARAAALSAEAWDYMEDVTRERFLRCSCREEDQILISQALAAEEPPIIVKGVLRMAIAALLGSEKDLTARHAEAAADLFAGDNGRMADLPGGLRARRTPEGVVIFRRARELVKKEEMPLAIPGRTLFGSYIIETRLEGSLGEADLEKHLGLARQKDFTKCFDYDKIKGTAQVRSRRRGDFLVIHPDGRRKSLSDILTDRKVPVGDRDRVPLVAIGSEVLWAVGVRTGEGHRIGPDTRRLLIVTAAKQDQRRGFGQRRPGCRL